MAGKAAPKTTKPPRKAAQGWPGQTREGGRQAAAGRWPDRLLHKLL